MKKTALQISSFLSQHSFKSDQDLNRILAICQSEGGLPSHSSYTIDTENGITVIDYLHWNDNCVGAGDICRMGDDLVICGICRLECATIVGKLSDDEILILDSETPQTALKLASDEERYDFMCIMLENRLQFSLKEMKLVEKYVPQLLQPYQDWESLKQFTLIPIEWTTSATTSTRLNKSVILWMRNQ